MNIQKMGGDDAHALAFTGQSQAQVMALPEVAAPRSNPLLMIWRRKGVLLFVMAVCVLAAAIMYWFSPQIFRSEARLFVHTNAPEGATGQNSLAAQCELIRSASILANVLATEEVASSRTLKEASSRWNTLKENLHATGGKDNDIITVSYDSQYPKEAQTILKAVVDAYSAYHTKEKVSRVFELEKWRDKAQEDLKQKQKELLEFKKANAALAMTGEKGNMIIQKLTSLQEASTAAHIDAVNARSAYDSVKEKLRNPTQLHALVEYLRTTGAVGNNDSNEQALRTQLMAMEAQAGELSRKYLPEHPARRAADGAVASLKARLAEMDRTLADTYVLALEEKITAAKNRETELQKAYDEQNKVAMALNLKAVEMEQIEGEVKRLIGNVEKADLQIVDIKASENIGAPTVQVFDEPSPPAAPIHPVWKVMLFQGLIIGLILGCLAAIVRDWTDQGLRSSEEITEALGIPLLGSVPHMVGPANPLAQGRKVDLEPSSDVAETYRTIRTAVFFGTPERESRTILVTSPAPGDGKSTFASNLAIAMAQTGKRVLLVDCDFRRPAQHRIFESRPGIGLSTVLAGHESLDKAIQNTGIAGLDILPAGPVPSNPAEILNSQSFNEVLEELSVRYEHVVLDSPPVMAVADARILAAMCSVTILVLRAQSSTRKAAMHARRALQSVGAQILGVVVNDVPRARDRHGDYGGYSAYRAKYNAANQAAPGEQNGGVATGARSSNAIVPARSFLDLRRK
jgi:succinoglycan biosynthesis transport protein ExoP